MESVLILISPWVAKSPCLFLQLSGFILSCRVLDKLPMNLEKDVQHLLHKKKKKKFINLNSVIKLRKQLSHFTCAEEFILGYLCGKGCLGLIELSGYLHMSTRLLYIEPKHLIIAPAREIT